MTLPGRGISACGVMAWELDAVECVDMWARADVSGITLLVDQVDRAGTDAVVRALDAHGMICATLQGLRPFDLRAEALSAAQHDEVRRALDLAVTLGTDCVVAVVGPRGSLTWDEALDRLLAQADAVLPELRSRGLRLAIEPISPIRQDLSFLNLGADAVDIVRKVDDPAFGYLFDVYHLWWQRDIEALARASAADIFCVQVSDYKAVTLRTLDRAVPGQGIIPLPRMLRALVDGGYSGWWEIEMISDDVATIGVDVVLRESTEGLESAWAAAAGSGESAP